MSSPENSPSTGDQSQGEVIPLEDIDKLLEAEDPEFSKELEIVKAVENDTAISIEASVVDDDELEAKVEESRLARARGRFRLALYSFKQNLKARLRQFGHDALVFLKTRPKEFALFSIVMLKILIKKAMVPVAAFGAASWSQRLAVLALIAIVVTASWVLLRNVKGSWLPGIGEPILDNLAEHAQFVGSYDPKEEGVSFYSAFPQERHEFLFRKMRVNLRPGVDSPNPMGAFELIVLVDSKDTAIEVRDREIEFFDDLQRVFEDESFNDLESDLGKAKLKGRIKRELNNKLTQGWIKDINFKTFIIKP